MTAHRVWLKLHQWAGLTGAAFIFVMGATGSALIFENAIDRALNPSTAYVTPAGRRGSPGQPPTLDAIAGPRPP